MSVAKTVFAWIGFLYTFLGFSVGLAVMFGWLERRWDDRRRIEDAVADFRDELAEW